MKQSLFWRIIDHSRRKAAGSSTWETTTRQAELLVRHLQKQDRKEIISFDRHFNAMMMDAYTRPMWLAVYLMYGHCDFVIFDRHLSWLIAQGRRRFERAVESPDTMAKYADKNIDTDDMLYVGYRAYKLGVGAEIESTILRAHTGMTDTPDSMEYVAMQFPNLALRFWG
jgi:hypothetical protein